MRSVVLWMVLTSFSCAPPPTPAPDGLADNVKWWWSNSAAATSAELSDAAGKLAAAGQASSRSTPYKGQGKRLEPSELKVVGLESNDPSKARGLMIVNTYPCTLEKLEQILISREQHTLYPGVYDAYERTYAADGDRDAYLARTKPTLAWTVAMKVSLPVDDQYSAQVKGSVTRITAPADGATKGPFLVARTHLPQAAAFKDPNSQSYFRQDYQIEVFWEESPGKIFHAYGMWREIRVGGFGLTLEDNGMLAIVLDNLVKWDDQTIELCKRASIP